MSEERLADGTGGEEAASAEAAPPRLYWILVASWLLPGAGHWLLGRKRRAVAFAVLVLASVAVGCLLDGNLHRILPNQPLTILATLGSMGMGAPYFVLRFLVGYQGDVIAPGYEYGSAFILTAGLMNLLVVLDAWDITRGRKS